MDGLELSFQPGACETRIRLLLFYRFVFHVTVCIFARSSALQRVISSTVQYRRALVCIILSVCLLPQERVISE